MSIDPKWKMLYSEAQGLSNRYPGEQLAASSPLDALEADDRI